MTQSQSHRSRFLFLLLATGVVALLLAGSLAAGDRTPAKKSVPAQAKDLSQYIGAETCKGCHEENFKKLETTPHWKTMLDTRRGKERMRRLLRLLETGRVDPTPLTTHRFRFDQIETAFQMMTTKADGIIKPLILF